MTGSGVVQKQRQRDQLNIHKERLRRSKSHKLSHSALRNIKTDTQLNKNLKEEQDMSPNGSSELIRFSLLV